MALCEKCGASNATRNLGSFMCTWCAAIPTTRNSKATWTHSTLRGIAFGVIGGLVAALIHHC